MSFLKNQEFSPAGNIQTRIELIRQKISRAAVKSNRSEREISLVAVTKTVAIERIREALKCGITDAGENRVQEAEPKIQELGAAAHWHLIGSLQSNKAKKAVQLFGLVQSVDRIALAQELNKRAAEAGKILECLVEVKTSTETTKAGVPIDQARELVEQVGEFKNLKLRGLMTIAPLEGGELAARKAFGALKKMFDQQRPRFGEAPILSMGMTDDYEAAIEEGSTMVRIGRGIFGER